MCIFFCCLSTSRKVRIVTKRQQKAATLAFVDWLTTLVVTLENNHGAGGGAGKARVVLVGHSYVWTVPSKPRIDRAHADSLRNTGWEAC